MVEYAPSIDRAIERWRSAEFPNDQGLFREGHTNFRFEATVRAVHGPSMAESKSSISTTLVQDHNSSLAKEAEELALSDDSGADASAPDLIHRFRHDRSILALAATEECLYAGTQGGDILVSRFKQT